MAIEEEEEEEEEEEDVDSTRMNGVDSGDPNAETIPGGLSSTSNNSFKFTTLLVAVTDVGELKISEEKMNEINEGSFGYDKTKQGRLCFVFVWYLEKIRGESNSVGLMTDLLVVAMVRRISTRSNDNKQASISNI